MPSLPLPGCYPGDVPHAAEQLLGGLCQAARQCELVSRPQAAALALCPGLRLPCSSGQALLLILPFLCPNAVTMRIQASWRTTRPTPAFQSCTPSTSSQKSESLSNISRSPPALPTQGPDLDCPSYPSKPLSVLEYATPRVIRTDSSYNPSIFNTQKGKGPLRALSQINIYGWKKKHIES